MISFPEFYLWSEVDRRPNPYFIHRELGLGVKLSFLELLFLVIILLFLFTFPASLCIISLCILVLHLGFPVFAWVLFFYWDNEKREIVNYRAKVGEKWSESLLRPDHRVRFHAFAAVHFD